jgi:hypothetical protein
METALHKITGGAGLQRKEEVLPVLVDRQNQYLHAGGPLSHDPDDVYPGHVRQVDVDDENVGQQLGKTLQGFLPGPEHAQKLDAVGTSEEGRQILPSLFMVFHNRHFCLHATPLIRSSFLCISACC